MLCSGFTPPCDLPATLTPEIRRRAVRSLFRALCRSEVIRTGLGDDVTDPAAAQGHTEEAASIGVAVEFGIALWSEFKTKPYARKLYSILWTLRHGPSTEQLLTRCEPCEVAFVREDTMMKNEASTEANAAVATLSSKLDRLEVALKTRLTAPRRSCPRCGCRDMERIALQLRAADEGMTTMLQCTNCSQRIRI
jgi:DNA-directed RNA polymerase subunit M/transcription elongation factor TFIIS